MSEWSIWMRQVEFWIRKAYFRFIKGAIYRDQAFFSMV